MEIGHDRQKPPDGSAEQRTSNELVNVRATDSVVAASHDTD